MAKGSNFEREICKLLSLWWTGGEDDAVFWRSSQSGGRATQRAKSGRKTFGSYGDIAAVNPIGQPLLKLFTIELKRGKSHGCPNDLFDCRPSKKPKPFEEALVQARRSAEQAESLCWMLISRRDGRESMAYVDGHVRHHLDCVMDGPTQRFSIILCDNTPIHFIGLRLSSFLDRVRPSEVAEAVERA